MNPSTLSGAIDVVVVQQLDGSLRGSPFHARFGKRRVLMLNDDFVSLYVNDTPVAGLLARLGPAGEVYFPVEQDNHDDEEEDEEEEDRASIKSGVGGGGSSGSGGRRDSARFLAWPFVQQKRKPPVRVTSAPAGGPPPRAYSLSSLLSVLGGEDDAAQQQPKLQNRLTPQQLRQLNLQPGRNRLRYEVSKLLRGTSSCCTCDVYLWRHDDRLVVSDIDGTITRSDLLGYLLPMLSKDWWIQPMVAELFTAVERNGYRFVYLSSRGLGQSEATRSFLDQVGQAGARLPDGPILLSPESVVSAFHREVIARRPQDFKIPCLRDVRHLFPLEADCPFWAGFGNRPSDADTYAEVGVPKSRCFTVNWRGELLSSDDGRLDDTSAAASYGALAVVVDEVFPP